MVVLVPNPRRMRRRRRSNKRGVPLSGRWYRPKLRVGRIRRSSRSGRLSGAALASKLKAAMKKRRSHYRKKSNPRRRMPPRYKSGPKKGQFMPRGARRRKNKARVLYTRRRRGGKLRSYRVSKRPRQFWRKRRSGSRKLVRHMNKRRRRRNLSLARNPRRRRRRRNYSGAYLMNPRRRRRRSYGRKRRRSPRRRRRNPFGLGGLSLRSFTGPIMNVKLWKTVAIGAVGAAASSALGARAFGLVEGFVPQVSPYRQYLLPIAKLGTAGVVSAVAKKWVGDDAAKAILIGTGVLVSLELLTGFGVMGMLGLGAYATEDYGLRGRIPGSGLGAFATEEYGLRGMIPGSGLGQEPLGGYFSRQSAGSAY